MAGNCDLTKAVRRVLVKNWLDMSKIRLQVAGATVIVRGRFCKNRDDDPVNGLFLEQVEQSIRSTKGVRNVRWILEDWQQDRGQWKVRQPD
jgi:hypothetical protein